MGGSPRPLVENQIREGAPAEVAGAHAFAFIATGQGDAALLIDQHMWLEAPHHAQIAAPGVGDTHILELRKEFVEQVAAQVAFVFVGAKFA